MRRLFVLVLVCVLPSVLSGFASAQFSSNGAFYYGGNGFGNPSGTGYASGFGNAAGHSAVPGYGNGFGSNFNNYGNGANYDSSGDIVGAAALLGSDSVRIAEMQIAAQAKLYGQQAEATQNAAVQNGIRSILTSQAAARANTLNSQQQSNQDWWFQYRVELLAQEQAAAYFRPAPQQPAPPNPAPSKSNAVPSNSNPSDGPSSDEGQTSSRSRRSGKSSSRTMVASAGKAANPSPAIAELIRWPAALASETFAWQRAQIESPYRRAPQKISEPTSADYRTMIGVVGEMKSMLDWKLKQGLQSDDYDTAIAFLNKMSDEASTRAEVAMHEKPQSSLR